MPALEDMHHTAMTFVQQAAADREPSPARNAGHEQLLRAGDGSRSSADTASPHANNCSSRSESLNV
jgi:hypothetical protein